MKADITGIGILGPGLEGWTASRAVLRGEADYDPEGFALPAPEILSSRERRRCSDTVRLALGVALEAVAQSGDEADQLAAVFGTSAGSGQELGRILTALSQPEMLVSPTHFHNSVHNSAVGYWCIATACHKPSTSVAAHDYTFAASLLKAAAQVATEARPVLLVVFDCPFPEPLHQKRPIAMPLAVSLVLTPVGERPAQATLEIAWRDGVPAAGQAGPSNPALTLPWSGNPAGRALPLLEAIARGRSDEIALLYPESGQLKIGLTL